MATKKIIKLKKGQKLQIVEFKIGYFVKHLPKNQLTGIQGWDSKKKVICYYFYYNGELIGILYDVERFNIQKKTK